MSLRLQFKRKPAWILRSALYVGIGGTAASVTGGASGSTSNGVLAANLATSTAGNAATGLATAAGNIATGAAGTALQTSNGAATSATQTTGGVTSTSSTAVNNLVTGTTGTVGTAASALPPANIAANVLGIIPSPPPSSVNMVRPASRGIEAAHGRYCKQTKGTRRLKGLRYAIGTELSYHLQTCN